MTATRLELRNVSKTYESDGQQIPALCEVSHVFKPGSVTALLGRSGCGKTTLLNMAGAMDFPSSGSVTVDGVCTTNLNDAEQTCLRRKKVGFVFQSFQLLHTLTAVENIELPLLLAGAPRAREAAIESLKWVELDGLGDRFPHQLSGGQMQRVAIARALVHAPKIILADEPTGNLDTITGGVVLEFLQRLTHAKGTATVMATHSQEAANLSDTVVRLRDGNIEEVTRR